MKLNRQPVRARVEPVEPRRLMSVTYYVDAVAGNDGAAGTAPDAAWQSVARVNAMDFEPGDAVLFRGGQSFGGNLRFDAADAGTAAAPVTVGSYDAGRATILAGSGTAVSVVNAGGFVVSNLDLVGAGRTSNTGSGVSFDNNLPGSVKLPFVRIDGVSASRFGKFGITLGGSGASGTKGGFDDVRITRAEAFDNATGGIETHGVFSPTAAGYANTNVYVGDSSAHDNPGYAGSAKHVGDGIVLSDVDGALIERSKAWNNGALNTSVGGPVGIWAWDANAVTIQYSESYANRTGSTADGGGFDLDGGVTNSVLQYNYSHDNDGPGYGLFQFAGARAFGNNTVRYNVSQNDARKNNYAGIQFWNGNGSNGVRDVEVYNNTVFVTPSPGATPRGIYVQSVTTNVHVRNNVFTTAGGVRLAEVAAKQAGLLFQGNDYWSSGAAFQIKDGAKSYSSLAAWRGATGRETLNGAAVGLNVNPGFVGAGGADAFRLSTAAGARSPLIDAGLDLWGRFAINPGPRDFYGTSLRDPITGSPEPQGNGFDIGAGEAVLV